MLQSEFFSIKIIQGIAILIDQPCLIPTKDFAYMATLKDGYAATWLVNLSEGNKIPWYLSISLTDGYQLLDISCWVLIALLTVPDWWIDSVQIPFSSMHYMATQYERRLCFSGVEKAVIHRTEIRRYPSQFDRCQIMPHMTKFWAAMRNRLCTFNLFAVERYWFLIQISQRFQSIVSIRYSSYKRDLFIRREVLLAAFYVATKWQFFWATRQANTKFKRLKPHQPLTLQQFCEFLTIRFQNFKPFISQGSQGGTIPTFENIFTFP